MPILNYFRVYKKHITKSIVAMQQGLHILKITTYLLIVMDFVYFKYCFEERKLMFMLNIKIVSKCTMVLLFSQNFVIKKSPIASILTISENLTIIDYYFVV